jgi:hypothetical protein
MEQYRTDWAEVSNLSGRGYVNEVIDILKAEGLEDIKAMEIYNVKSGVKKDLVILAAIRKVLLPQKQEEPVKEKLTKKSLNLV